MLAPYCLAADNPSAAAIGSKLLRHCQSCPDVISALVYSAQISRATADTLQSSLPFLGQKP